MELGEKYLNGVFREPLPGRGEALVTWACEAPDTAKRYPKCKARAVKQGGHAPAPKAP
jgi:hypothetical protein